MSSDPKKAQCAISATDKARLIQKMRGQTSQEPLSEKRKDISFAAKDLAGSNCSFKDITEYKNLNILWTIAQQSGIEHPFFTCHEDMAKDTTQIRGQTYLNFSTYDYLNFNGSSAVNRAASEAMEKYGTSASASRIVSGERPVHKELEKGLAEFYGLEDCLTFVSGHATNIWVLCQLFNHNDLIIYDELIHNSLLKGAQFSGARRISFPHNDYERLNELLLEYRASYKRAVLISEGLFSMDGDIPDLPRLVKLKKRHNCFLMIDEAHSLGTLGPTGKGICDHFNMPATNIDILMGTLSKVLCGCGGFIAGKSELVEYLKFTAPGFIYSVGMSPPLAAASLAALKELQSHPQRVTKLQEISSFFLEYARHKGLDTGRAVGRAVVPIILKNSLLSITLSSFLGKRKINALPIIYPAVEENMARLRFFLNSRHSQEQVRQALDITVEELYHARKHLQELRS